MDYFWILTKFAHVINKKDVGYIRLYWSIGEKVSIHNYFLSQLNHYFRIVKEEINEWDRKGIKTTESHTKLLGYFEAILNNAYSIMETIAKITLPFFSKNNVPRGFHKQLIWFEKKENRLIDEEYSNYLREFCGWYDELREVRSEPAHFLSGLIVFEKDKNGVYTPKYFNKIKSERDKKVFKGDSINLELEFAHKIGIEIRKFLEFYGKHFVSKLDPNEETKINIILTDKKTGKTSIKQFSAKLKDLISGKVKISRGGLNYF